MIGAPSLRGLQAFEAAARSGSFVAAARELAVSPAAVSQLIRALEDQVGRRLFHRVNRRVVLTEAGAEILPQIATAFRDLRGVSRELVSGERRSSLVVSVPPSLAVDWLPQRLPAFVDAHGPVDISLRGEDDPVPFERETIDIRFSYGRFYEREHETEELATDAVHPVCSPACRMRHGPFGSPDDLLAAPLIHTDWGPSGASFPSWRSWFEAAAITPGRRIQRGMTANSSKSALELAVAGLGVALGQGIFCARAIRAGTLVVAVPRPLALGQPYCLTVPQGSARRAVVTAFRRWLRAECLDLIEPPALP